MPVPKPASIPDWASSALGLSRTLAPPPQMVLDGWVPGYRPPAQYFNWLMQQVAGWEKWLNDINNQALDWTALQTYEAGLMVHGTSNFPSGSIVNIDTLNVTNRFTQPTPSVHSLAAATGWNFSSVDNFARWFQTPDGICHLEARGSTTSSSPSNQVFSAPFPVGSRPITMLPLFATEFGASEPPGNAVLSRLFVNPDGTLNYTGGGAVGRQVFFNCSWYGS